jgi:hypothetical protein
MVEVIVWDDREDERTILNRAKAGMTAFGCRAYIEGSLQVTSDPTEYCSGAGYNDYNTPVQFSLRTKRSEWGAKRMAVFQGVSLFHITNSGSVEDWTSDVTEKLGFNRPTLAVSSGTDAGVTIFVGRQIDAFASRIVQNELAARALRQEDEIYDGTIEWCPDYEKLAAEVRELVPA